MRVLFAILMVALAGLVWATVAAAQHIRRARLRQRGLPVEKLRPHGTELPSAAAPPPPPTRTDSMLRQTQFGMH